TNLRRCASSTPPNWGSGTAPRLNGSSARTRSTGKELSIFCTNTSTGPSREPVFPPFVKEVDRCAEQDQQDPESRVDHCRLAGGGRGAIAPDVGVNGQHQEGQRESREERRQHRI